MLLLKAVNFRSEIQQLRAFLFTVSKNCFLFSKTRRTRKTYLVSRFFFFVIKDTKKIIKFKEREEFSKNTKKLFSVFSKTVFNNSFQKQKPNMPNLYGKSSISWKLEFLRQFNQQLFLT